MVIVVGEEVGDTVAVNKAVFLIEGQSERAFPGAQLHTVEISAVTLTENVQQTASVALTLKSLVHGQIFQFAESVSLVGDHCHSNGTLPAVEHIQLAPFQVAVDHALLLVAQQQQRQKILLVFFDVSKRRRPPSFHYCSKFPEETQGTVDEWAAIC